MATRNDERRTVGEEKAMEVAEASRQAEIREPSFLKELFLAISGSTWSTPFPKSPSGRFHRILRAAEGVPFPRGGSVEIDATGNTPPASSTACGSWRVRHEDPHRVRRVGAEPAEYDKVMKLLGSTCANLAALLKRPPVDRRSPSRSRKFGTEEQNGSSFPASPRGHQRVRPDGGRRRSDPARLSTTLEDRGDHYC